MTDISLWKKKLVGYSALSSAVLAVAQQKADGQIIYHDIDPDALLTTNSSAGYLIDMDNDGIFDFKISRHEWDLFQSIGRILPYNSDSILHSSYGNKYIRCLSGGQSVSANATDFWSPSYSYSNLFFHNSATPWNHATDKYAGIILNQTDGKHYGWIRMSHEENWDTIIIKDFAYQSLPETPLLAGQVDYTAQVGADVVAASFDVWLNNHQLYIHFNQAPLPSQVILFNSLGTKLREATITQTEFVMDVSKLSAGVYFVVVENGSGRRVKKIVIESR